LHQIQAKFRDLHAIQANAELWIKSSKQRFSGLESQQLIREPCKKLPQANLELCKKFKQIRTLKIRALH
jgi:hypothetical protein